MTDNTKREARQTRLIAALAKAPARTRGGRTDTATKQAARLAAHDLKLKAASDALDASEKREEAEQVARFGRLSAIGAELADLKREKATYETALTNGLTPDIAAGLANMAQRMESLKLEQSTLYGQPIHPTDLASNGRFIRSIRWHARTVVNVMQSAREDDILSEAIMLCYLDADAVTEVTRGYDASGAAITEQWPTIGGMYKKIRAAYRDNLDQFRQIKRGLIGVRSLDELAAAGIEPTQHFEHYGIQHLDPADIDWDAVVTGRVQDASMSRYAMKDADRRAQAAKLERETVEAYRLEAVKSSSAPSGLTAAGRNDFEVDRILIEGLIDGETLADLAADLGVTVDTLTRRLAGRTLTSGLRA